MPDHVPQRPHRCSACELLYYPRDNRAYLCDVCQDSLEDYVKSMAGHENPTIAWWRRQQALRAEARRGATANR
jgi:hypothetical protein